MEALAVDPQSLFFSFYGFLFFRLLCIPLTYRNRSLPLFFPFYTVLENNYFSLCSDSTELFPFHLFAPVCGRETTRMEKKFYFRAVICFWQTITSSLFTLKYILAIRFYSFIAIYSLELFKVVGLKCSVNTHLVVRKNQVIYLRKSIYNMNN